MILILTTHPTMMMTMLMIATLSKDYFKHSPQRITGGELLANTYTEPIKRITAFLEQVRQRLQTSCPHHLLQLRAIEALDLCLLKSPRRLFREMLTPLNPYMAKVIFQVLQKVLIPWEVHLS
jgi:hypothetical protein